MKQGKRSGQFEPAACLAVIVSRYFLSAGGLAERSTSVPAGLSCGGVGGVVAAPVVMPGSVLLRGVTSRIPGGAAGLAGWVCAVWAGGAVEA